MVSFCVIAPPRSPDVRLEAILVSKLKISLLVVKKIFSPIKTNRQSEDDRQKALHTKTNAAASCVKAMLWSTIFQGVLESATHCKQAQQLLVINNSFQKHEKYKKYFNISAGVCRTTTLSMLVLRALVYLIRKQRTMYSSVRRSRGIVLVYGAFKQSIYVPLLYNTVT